MSDTQLETGQDTTTEAPADGRGETEAGLAAIVTVGTTLIPALSTGLMPPGPLFSL